MEMGLGNGESPLHAAGFQPEEVHLAAMNFSPVLSMLNPINPPRDVHRDALHKGWKGKGLQALLTSVVKDYSKSTRISGKKLGDFFGEPPLGRVLTLSYVLHGKHQQIHQGFSLFLGLEKNNRFLSLLHLVAEGIHCLFQA